MTIPCYKCKAPLQDPWGFSVYCQQCFTYQHCCLNCKHYNPSKSNACNIPEAELISDKEHQNSCLYMERGLGDDEATSSKDKAYRLFGIDPPIENELSAEERFKKLFDGDKD